MSNKCDARAYRETLILLRSEMGEINNTCLSIETSMHCKKDLHEILLCLNK